VADRGRHHRASLRVDCRGIGGTRRAREFGAAIHSRCKQTISSSITVLSTVISDDNDEWPGTTLDPSFMQIGSGLHIGYFSNISETWEKIGIDYRFPLRRGRLHISGPRVAMYEDLVRNLRLL
jgi:hypothetical protein